MSARTNVGDHLITRARLGGALEAVVDLADGERLTFAQMNERADRLAHLLTSLGIRKGDRIGVLLPNGYRYIEIYYGAARAGIVVVPINLRLVAEEVAYILRDANAETLIFGDAHAALVAELRHRTGDAAVPVKNWVGVGLDDAAAAQPYDELHAVASAQPYPISAGDDEPMFIMYTSGTTGRPKGTIHTHTTIQWALLSVVMTMDMRDRDRYLISMPFYHIAAFNNLGTTLYRGGVIVILQKFEADETWNALRDERITCTLAVPAMLTQLLATYNPYRHSPLALRWVLTGAQAMPLPLLRSLTEMGLSIIQAYGLTEAAGVGCCMTTEDAWTHPTSIGKGFLHTEARVVDPEGNDCPPDVPGELVLRGRQVMAGYWNLPTQTAETVRDGWLHTGDVATMDAEGFFYLRDRLKDMIISGGENIYPAEIEAVLITHPHIAEVSVIGIPSARWGESPLAVIVRRSESLDEEAVLHYCEGKLARFKLPKSVKFIDQIPRNATGKALKTTLRQQFALGALR